MNKYLMRIYYKNILPAVLLLMLAANVEAQKIEGVADGIVAIVNGEVILKSEIDLQVLQFMQQSAAQNRPLQFSKELWFDVLESSIENRVLLEKAKIDSIVVDDDQVNRQMSQRIQELVRQAGSEKALEDAFGKTIVQLRNEYREQFREDMVSQEVRMQQLRKIKITRPEIVEFFNAIPKDSLPMIPERVALSHIVSLPPPKEDAKKAAYDFANQLRDSVLTHGVPFEDLAKRHSTDPAAPRGGLLPMMNLNDLVPEFSAAAAALQPGGISEVVETIFGFHVIRLNRRIGEQIETNHILISVKSSELDDQYSIKKLNTLRDSLLNNPSLKFSDFAKRHSEDPATSQTGGRLMDSETGERLIALQSLDPALYRAVLVLDQVGEISEPRPFDPNGANSGKAYRIVRLDERVEEHRANIDQDFNFIRRVALQRKQAMEMNAWMENIKKDMYIEYRVEKPKDLSLNK